MMPKLPTAKRMKLREYWRWHLIAWQNSDMNQREYCEAHDLPLKRFGNWRAELRHEMPPPPVRLLYRRSVLVKPRLKPELNKEKAHLPPGYMPAVPQAPPQGRRYFSPADKRNIVAEISKPANSLSGIARRYGLSRRLLLTWKKTYGPKPDPVIVPVTIIDDGEPVTGPAVEPVLASTNSASTPEIEITLKSGHHMRVPVGADPKTISALLIQLEGASS